MRLKTRFFSMIWLFLFVIHSASAEATLNFHATIKNFGESEPDMQKSEIYGFTHPMHATIQCQGVNKQAVVHNLGFQSMELSKLPDYPESKLVSTVAYSFEKFSKNGVDCNQITLQGNDRTQIIGLELRNIKDEYYRCETASKIVIKDGETTDIFITVGIARSGESYCHVSQKED